MVSAVWKSLVDSGGDNVEPKSPINNIIRVAPHVGRMTLLSAQRRDA